MKRLNNHNITLFLCSMLFLLTACNEEPLLNTDPDPEPDSTPRAISLQIAELLTKGSIEEADSILSLGIFGYSTGEKDYSETELKDRLPNLIYNQEVSRAGVTSGKNTNAWTYNPVAYWPENRSAKNTFFAYSPHSSKFPPEAKLALPARTDTGYPKIIYTVPQIVSRQVDILYADSAYNRVQTQHGDTVNYKMKHALSWLIFLAAPVQRKNEEGQVDTFKIKSLRFIVDTLVDRAQLNLGTGEWIPLETSSANYEFEVDTARKIPANTIRIITASSSRLMLIPQIFTQKSNPSAIDVVFTVSGDSQTGDDNDEYFYSIPFPDTKLHAGGVTMYLLRLSTDGVTVKFYGYNNIDNWEAGEELPPIDVF